MVNEVKRNTLFYKNFSIYFLGLITSGLISFFVIPLIVRLYGVEVYGEFSIFQNIVLILISFGSGWLNQCILRFNNYSFNFKFNIYQLYIVTIIPILFFAFVLVFILNNNLILSVIAMLTIFFGGFSAILMTFLQSKFKASKFVFVDGVRTVTFLTSILVFAFLLNSTKNFFWLVIGFFFSYLITFLFFFRLDKSFFISSFKSTRVLFEITAIKEFLSKQKNFISYGWPLALWFTASSILNVSDRFVIDYFLTKKDVGIYSAIYDLLYKGIAICYAPILASGFPLMSSKFNDNKKMEAFRLLKKMMFLELIMFVVIFVVAYFFRNFFLESILGLHNGMSFSLVLPVLTGAFIWQLAMLAHKPLEFELKTKKMLLYVLFSLFINVILNIIFIPRLGLIFAAYSTIISSILYLLFTFLDVRFNRNLKND